MYHDTADTLPPKTCIVTDSEGRGARRPNGTELGKVAVWKYPLIAPTDIQVWTVRAPPSGQKYPRNSVIVSR
eukprot:3748547-Prorocentrum_lima.AAC.1